MPRNALRWLISLFVMWLTLASSLGAQQAAPPNTMISFKAKQRLQRNTMDVVVHAFYKELDDVGFFETEPGSSPIEIEFEWAYDEYGPSDLTITYSSAEGFIGQIKILRSDTINQSPFLPPTEKHLAAVAAADFAWRWQEYIAPPKSYPGARKFPELA